MDNIPITTDIDAPVVKTRGNYFLMSKEAIRTIRQNESSDSNGVLQAVYSILCCYTNKHGFTYAGSNAISKLIPRTGRDKAEHYINELQSICLDDGDPILPAYKTEKRKRNFKPYIGTGDDTFCIPNIFVNSKGQQGLSESHLTKICRLIASKRKPTLSLMLEIYAEYDVLSYWGCDPRRSLYKSYDLIGDNDPYEIEPIYTDNDRILKVYEIDSKAPMAIASFIEQIGVDKEKFWDAYDQLYNLGCIYELVTVFSDDVLQNAYAEPLYILYCGQRHARNNKPIFNGLSSQALNCIDEFTDIRMAVYSDARGSPYWVCVAPKECNASILGIIRPRYVAYTDDEESARQSMSEIKNIDDFSRAFAAT